MAGAAPPPTNVSFHAAAFSSPLPLLLRLYEQAKDQDQALYLRCLDLWDRLLERRVGAAMGLTQELDRF